MARDKAYQAAEQKIEQARRSGAKELDLNCDYGKPDSEKLTELPESLGQLTQLQWLNINENQFGNSFQDAAKCWKTLSSLPKLRQLFFSGNLLTKVEKRLPELLRIIANAPSLSSLFLSRNQLSEIPNEIASIGRLSTLFLDSNRLTDLPSSLGKHPHLHHLELGENPPNWRLPTRRASTPLNATCTRWRKGRETAMKPSCWFSAMGTREKPAFLAYCAACASTNRKRRMAWMWSNGSFLTG